MKLKSKLLIFAIIIIGISLCIYIMTHQSQIQSFREDTRKSLYGDPIDLTTGIINNKYFNINSEGKNAEQTTEGINEAIEYANKNNIEYIKFQKGIYLINGIGERDTEKGIIVKSNLTIDFDNSTIQHIKNSSIRYSVFNLHQVDNVELKNAIIIGDKEEHDYNSINSTHEWGYGIEIKASSNVKLNHLEIMNMTGDGILISDYHKNNEKSESYYIEITNNRIHDCRRQGITIGAARNVKIYQNEIYSIRGTLPAAAIDIEPDNTSQIVKNIDIYENKIYNANRLNAVQIHRYIQTVSVYNNEINGNFLIYECEDKITVSNNKITNANILIQISKESMAQNKQINKVVFERNEIINSDMTVKNVKDILLEKNSIIDTNLAIVSSNIAINSNFFDSRKNVKECAYSYMVEEGDTLSYKVYVYNNTIQGNYKENDKIQQNIQIMLDTKLESLNHYINEKFK